MDLYRVILVNDEEKARQGIIRRIDWMEVGFCVVRDVENRGEALEKMEALKPDLVLTNIRTFFMDGLSLAGRVRQKYPSVEIVIFSGYDDLDYVKRVIKLNMTEHILKPVSVEELTATSKCIKSNLDDGIEQKRDVSLLHENCIHSLPILRDQSLNELVGSIVPGNISKEKLAERDIPLVDAKKQVAAAIGMESEEIREGNMLPPHKERDLIPISVMQVVEEKLGNYCRSSVFTPSRISWPELTLIAAIDRDNGQTRLIDVLGDVCKETRKILEVSIIIGTGYSCQDPGEVSSSYKTAVDALDYKVIVGTGSTTYANDVEPADGEKLNFDGKDETEFIVATEFGPREKIEEAVQAVMDKVGDARMHFRQCQAYTLSVSSSIVQLIQQYDLDLGQLTKGGEEQEDTFTVIPRMMKEKGFIYWFLSAALRMNQVMNRKWDNTMKQVIQKAKEYTMDSYRGPDLSVEKVCCQLHMNPAYLSTMFRKEMGQAYTAYLTQVRLDKAVEFLNRTDDETYVTAAEVGYQEQNCFNYVLKKRFGVSPVKFRGVK